MNDEQLDDLKQFIDSRVSQSELRTEKKIDELGEEVGGLREGMEDLRKEMLDGFAGVGEAIDEINKHVDARLTKLEQRAV